MPATTNAIPSKSKANGSSKNDASIKSEEPTPVPLIGTPISTEREAEILMQIKALGKDVVSFPGKLHQRAAWMERIQEAAQRDAADLILAPMSTDEPPLTVEEINGQKDLIVFMRQAQARWIAVFIGEKKAAAEFQTLAEEAMKHRYALLRFFSHRLRNDANVQKRISKIREGWGDTDLVQDVSEVLELCREHAAELPKGARGEVQAAKRLAEIEPDLSRALAGKALSKHAIEERRMRDGAFTLAMKGERRIRMAAEYMFDGTDKIAVYAAFPASSGKSAPESDEEQVAEEVQDMGPANED